NRRLEAEPRWEDVNVPGGHRDELRHPAVHRDTELLELLAEVHPPDLAVAADPTADADLDGHGGARRHFGHALADGDDFPRDLVTDDEPAPSRRIGLVVDPLVAAADPRHPDPHKHLPRPHRRDGHVLEDDAALGRVLDDGEHAGPSTARRTVDARAVARPPAR